MTLQRIPACTALYMSASVHSHTADKFVFIQQGLFKSFIIPDSDNTLEGVLKQILLFERIRPLYQFKYGSCRCRIDAGIGQPLQDNLHRILVFIIQCSQHIRLQFVELFCAEQTQGVWAKNTDDSLERLDPQRAAGLVEVRKQHGGTFDAVYFPKCVEYRRGNQRRAVVQSLNQYVYTGTVLDFCQSFHHGVLNPFLIAESLSQTFHSLGTTQFAKTYRGLVTDVDLRIVKKNVAERSKSHGTVGRTKNIRNEDTYIRIWIVQEFG